MKNSQPDRPLEQWSRESHRLVYRFQDTEEAQSHLSGNYASVRISSQDRASFDLSCSAAILGNIAFTSNSSHSGFGIEFGHPFDGYGMSLPASGSMLLDGGGKTRIDSMEHSGLVVDSIDIASATFSPRSSWRRIMMPSDELHRHIAVLTEQPVRQRVRFSNHFSRHSAAARSIFAIDQIIANGMQGDAPLLAAPAALASLRNAVLSLFVEGMPHSHSMLLARPVPSIAPRHVKRAIDFMHANVLSPLRLEDIARAAGASARSLQLGFRQYRDTTPMEYLRELRLRGAHHDLLHAPGGTTVASVAYRWGFAHHGLFAASYARMFGRPPSATLGTLRED